MKLAVWFGCLLLVCGTACRSSREQINAHYRSQTMVWGLGDTAWRTALYYSDEKGRWKQLWPSVPLCHGGESWMAIGDSLVFIGWSKDAKGPGDRRLLWSKHASPATDITDEIVLRAKRGGLIPSGSRFGEDTMFDGLKLSDGRLQVEIAPLTKLGGYRVAIPLADPEQRPNQSPEPTVMSVTPPAAQESRQP